MTNEQGLFQAILNDPDNDHLRLVYADLLDDNGECARAEFIRVQIALAGASNANRSELRARETYLRMAHEAEWTASLRRLVKTYEFQRGFVEEVRVEARAFADRADLIFAEAPLRHLALYWSADPPHERARFVSVLTACPHLRRLHTLDLADSYIGSTGVRALAVCEYFERLTALNLSRNHIGEAGARALAEAAFLSRLTHLDLSNNDLGRGALRALAGGFRALEEAGQVVALRNLNLSGNPIGLSARAEILNSPILQRTAWPTVGNGQEGE